MTNGPKTLIIAGGGTGGHVLAGVAVADAWKARVGPSADVLFVGAQGGIEEKLVPRAGYPLEVLKLGSLNRVSLERKLKTYAQLPFSLLRSMAILFNHQPDAVLGVGGYASGPLVLMARFLSFFRLIHARTAILEQNSIPGFTNRVLGRFVEAVFCAFPGTEDRFRDTHAYVTGNPIRSSMKRLPSATRDPFTLFVFGGSQGAQGINSLVLEALPHLKDLNTHLRYIHQTGEKDYERTLQGHRAAGTSARVEKFIHDMPSAYAESSLVICRSGSSTLAEIAAVGRAAVLIPLPTASDGHQERNARVFSDSKAATLLVQTGASGLALAKMIRSFYENPEQLAQMESAVTRFWRPDAAGDISRRLVELASGAGK